MLVYRKPDPNAIADFIYKTANSQIKYLARFQGNQAYINNFKSQKNKIAWRVTFETLMSCYSGNKFTFAELRQMCKYNGKKLNPKYKAISLALYKSLKPHY